MKDRRWSLLTMFHWTEQKIRVHAQYCVLALASPADGREAKNAGMVMSVRSSSPTSRGSRRP